MTTSSDHRKPSSPHPSENWGSGEHWFELTATLSIESTEQFGTWLKDELCTLELQLDSYITPNSLRKSIRRSTS